MVGKLGEEGLGERIEWLRNAAGLSARELDALAGLRAGHTRSLETGVISNVGVHTLEKIAGVFGASLDWLVKGEGARRSKKAIVGAVNRARAAAGTGEKTGTTD